MKNPNSYVMKTLKKELSCAIVYNNYNLLAPEILRLSKELDVIMNPLFKIQLENTLLLDPINY